MTPLPQHGTLRRGLSLVAVVATASLALDACGSTTATRSVSTSTTSTSTATSSGTANVPVAQGTSSSATDASAGSTGASSIPAAHSSAVPLRINVAGDTQAHGVAGAIDTQGLGATGRVLGDADLSMVNLETVVADPVTGLTPEPKTFTFVTGPRILTVLKDSGVDLVTAANNHGMDYGREGLRRMLQVKDRHILPIVGMGHTIDEAFQPYVTTVRGRRIVVFGATDMVEPGFDWGATATRAGLARIDTAGGLQVLEQAVARQRAADPEAAIMVYLHWGHELVRCPTARQFQIAKGLSDAGATVVVGSHAHIQQPTSSIGHTAVAYGLGNFVFGSGHANRLHTGVLTIDVPASTGETPTMHWTPALIEGGLPHLLQGTAKQQGIEEFDNLDQGCSR